MMERLAGPGLQQTPDCILAPAGSPQTEGDLKNKYPMSSSRFF